MKGVVQVQYMINSWCLTAVTGVVNLTGWVLNLTPHRSVFFTGMETNLTLAN